MHRRYRDQGGRDRTDLTLSASWELYVDMRFDQLRTACDLELWAEAFRSVEDIQVGFWWGFRGDLHCGPGVCKIAKRKRDNALPWHVVSGPLLLRLGSCAARRRLCRPAPFAQLGPPAAPARAASVSLLYP